MSWPEDVGILALEIYFPKLCVDQNDLEQYDGVSKGKYTIGLGQEKMGVCSDLEDVQSMCLTVTNNLITRNNIDPSRIGRLDVGTESRIDRSKSIKSLLMSLLPEHVFDVEGLDSTNACFGGTQALFDAVNWIESSSCDGRLALVVMGDVAVYAPGPARPTGGAGAIAMLVGPNAPLVMERGLRSFVMKHSYDFFKPDPTSNYPVVNGKDSLDSYIQCLQTAYINYKLKAVRMAIAQESEMDLTKFDALLFHSPFAKLTMKAVARMAFVDYKSSKSQIVGLEQFRDMPLWTPLDDRALLDAFVKHSKDDYMHKTDPSLLMARQIGNMYTPSLYGGLVSLLLSGAVETLCDKRIGLYSYGSGAASCFYSMKTTGDPVKLKTLVDGVQDANIRLQQRTVVTPHEFTNIMKIRETLIARTDFTPSYELSERNLFAGSYYLLNVSVSHVRKYVKFDASNNIDSHNGNNNHMNGKNYS